MQCGAPLLLSRSSSIPEVAGDSAFYFDPENLESMEDTFIQARNDPDLIMENVKKGILKSREFTWENAAKRIFSLYNKHR